MKRSISFRIMKSRPFRVFAWAVFLFLIFTFSYVYVTRASIARFSPTSCFGGWEGSANAQGKPDLSEGSLSSEFTQENAAVAREPLTHILCEKFEGEIPEGGAIERVRVKFSWGAKEEGKENKNVSLSSFFLNAFSSFLLSDTNDDKAVVQEISLSHETTTQEGPLHQEEGEETLEEVADEPLLEVLYTRNGSDWESLGKPAPKDLAGAVFELPLKNWSDIGSIQISAKTLASYNANPFIFLDGLWLEVAYKEAAAVKQEEGTGDGAIVPAVSLETLPRVAIQSGQVFAVTKKDFAGSETPSFTLNLTSVISQSASEISPEKAPEEQAPAKEEPPDPASGQSLNILQEVNEGEEKPAQTRQASPILPLPETLTPKEEPQGEHTAADENAPVTPTEEKPQEAPKQEEASPSLKEPQDTPIEAQELPTQDAKEQKETPLPDQEKGQSEQGDQENAPADESLSASIKNFLREFATAPFVLFQRVFSPAFAENAAPPSRILKAVVIDPKEEETDITPVITEEGDKVATISIVKPERVFKPGKYTLHVEILGGDKVFVAQQDFTWGVLAINTDKSIYLPGDTAYLQMGILNDSGETTCDGELELHVTNAATSEEKIFTTQDGTIEKSGKCGPTSVVDMPDYFTHYTVTDTGVYEMRLTNTLNGYTISDSFEVRDAVPFDVTRVGPTRVFPLSPYQMELRIKINQDFRGRIEEFIPKEFSIISSYAGLKESGKEAFEMYDAQFSEKDNADSKELSWKDISVKKGDELTLTYLFDPPDSSPAFFLLGPLTFVKQGGFLINSHEEIVFQEARKWQIAIDAVRTWDGGGTDGTCGGGVGDGNKWSCAANWSVDTVPGSADTATFDGTSTKDATVDASFAGTITTLNMNSGYTGTITLARSLTVSGAFTQAAGTINLSDQSFSVSGGFTISGGTFSEGTSTMTFSGGGATIDVATNETFYNLTFNPSTVGSTKTVAASDTLIVTNTLTLTEGLVSQATIPAGGTIATRGDITQNGTLFDGGTGKIVIDGTGNQTFTGGGSTSAGTLPDIEINKASGTLTLSSIIRTTNDWTFTSVGTGSIAGTGTVVFSAALTISGNHTLPNVTFNGAGTAYTVASGTTLTVSGTLTLTDGSINTGTVVAQGDMTQVSTFDGGTGALHFTGSANQTFTGGGSTSAGTLPDVTINKSGGSLALSNIIRTTNDWTYTAGTIDITTNDSTLVFAAALAISGSHTLDKVTFNGVGTSYTIASGTTLTVADTLTLTDGSIATGTVAAQGAVTQVSTFDGGTGALNITGSANQTFTGGGSTSAGTLPDVTINKTGGTLTLSSTIRTTNDWTYTAGTVDATTNDSTIVFAGTLTISGTHTLDNVNLNVASGNVTFTSGTLSLSTLTVGIAVNASMTFTVDGTVTVASAITINRDFTIGGTGTLQAQNNVTITREASTNSTTTTVNAGTTFTIAGSLTLGTNDTSTGHGDLLSNGTVTVAGDLNLFGASVDGTGSVAVRGAITQTSNFDGGSGKIVIDGTGSQLFTGGGSNADLTAIEINKASGTLTLSAGTIRTTKNWTYLAGTVDATTNDSTVTFDGTLTIAGTHTLDNVSLNIPSGTVTIASGTTLNMSTLTIGIGTADSMTMTVNGTAIVAGAVTLDRNLTIGGTGSLEIQGATTIKNPSSTGDSTVTVNAGTTLTITNALTITSADGSPEPTFSVNGTAIVTGTLSLTDGDIAGTGVVNARGDITQASGFLGGTGKILIDGTGNQTFTGGGSATAGDLPDIEINKSAGTLTFSSTIRTTNDWTYTAGTVDATTNDSTVVFAGTLTLDGQGTSTTMAFDNVDIRTSTVTLGGNLDVDGNLTITSGTLNVSASNFSINVAGNWTDTSTGTFTEGSGTVTFDGTGTVNANETFESVTIGGSGTVTLGANLQVDGTFAMTGGTLALVGFDITNTLNATRGNIAGTIRLQGGTDSVFWTTNDTDSGTYEYVGDGDGFAENFTVLAFTGADYFNLTINDINATKDTFVAPASLDIDGAFSLSSSTFNQSTNTMNVAGTFALASGTTFTKSSNSSALTLDGTGAT